MRNAECARIQEALRFRGSTAEEERHLFSCPDCRLRVKLTQAWKSLPRLEDLEKPELADEVFVARVLDSIRRDRHRRRRLKAGLAAAAALLFFFLAGAASQMAATATSGADDAYAQLVEPSSALDSLLPE